jgi:hypothetical protein
MTTIERLARAGPRSIGALVLALLTPGGLQFAFAQTAPQPITISLVGPVKIGDGIRVVPPVMISLSEGITITEGPRVTPPAVISLTDHITIAGVTDALAPPLPTAIAGGPYTAPVGVPTELIGAGSDPNGRPLIFAWDLDGSGTFSTPGRVITIITSGRPGDLTVTLRVCDDWRLCATSTAIVHVVSAPDGGGTGSSDGGPPRASATPELDSLLLFASGLAGVGAYALVRLRARRRPQA